MANIIREAIELADALEKIDDFTVSLLSYTHTTMSSFLIVEILHLGAIPYVPVDLVSQCSWQRAVPWNCVPFRLQINNISVDGFDFVGMTTYLF